MAWRWVRRGTVITGVALFALMSVLGASSAPQRRLVTFTESSVELGVAEAILETWGLATVDWDDDGCDDLYVGRHGLQFPHLYRNGCPGPFTNETWRLHLDELPWKKTHDRHTPSFADYDADGLMDLFIVTGGGSGRTEGNEDQLFHQLPDGNFENVAPDLGMTDLLGSGRHAIWFDYDQDRDLDLFVGHFPQVERLEFGKNILWRQRNGAFFNAARRARIDTIERSHTGIVSDLDLDGDLDIVLAPGEKTTVYLNRGDGTFAKNDLSIGQVNGIAAGDFDNDGDQDLFLTRGRTPQVPVRSVLLRNDGGVWDNITSKADVGFYQTLTPIWLDVDNDGDLDLYVTRNIDGTGINQPNLLLLNDGKGKFVDDAGPAGVTGPADGALDSATWADPNRDGVLDLAVLISGSQTAVQYYLNHGNENRWITVRLQDPVTKNRKGIGAKVWATIGGRTQFREVITNSRESQSPIYVHFGFGPDATVVDKLRVGWPDGREDTFQDVPVNVHYLALRGGGLRRLR